MQALLALTVPIFHAQNILEMAERISFQLLKAPFRPRHLHFWVTFQRNSLSKGILIYFLITTSHYLIFLLYEIYDLPFIEFIAFICDSLWIPAYLFIHPHLISILGLFQLNHFLVTFEISPALLSLTSFRFLMLTWENSTTQSNQCLLSQGLLNDTQHTHMLTLK